MFEIYFYHGFYPEMPPFLMYFIWIDDTLSHLPSVANIVHILILFIIHSIPFITDTILVPVWCEVK
jgi:hypothetical protein